MIESATGPKYGASATSLPSISIVTICKNAGATIGRTLESVSKCDYPRLEYVVVDGGSTDGTLDHIRQYQSCIDKFVSEPDGGISDALNKAVEMTEGDYHLVVHSDDVLMPDSVATLAQSARNGGTKVICGSVQVMGDRGVVRKFTPSPQELVRKMSVPHMGALIRKDAWTAVRRYDVRRRVAMDHLLMLRILRRFGPDAFSIVDAIVANYFLGGVSDRHVNAGFREVRENLIEEGIGQIQANTAYVRLILKARVARLIGMV
jgi:glycosyltransferase involved in cell wall biosynthesis